MDFSLPRAKAVLTRTPATLRDLVVGLPEEWTTSDEGPGTWSPYQTVGHMTAVEELDWMDRTMTILAEDGPRHFEPVDREAGFTRYAGWTLSDLVERFDALRSANLEQLARVVSESDLERTGLHPDFGVVTLAQLLATWVVHDLNHLDQIAKTMAKQFTQAIGPWRAFLPIVDAP
ncbi:MAG: DinB family protein [Acidimicrobiales bacterium]